MKVLLDNEYKESSLESDYITYNHIVYKVLIHAEFNETISYADRRLHFLIFRLYWGCPLLWKLTSPAVALELPQ